jgi:RNA polymerase sigma-70 factor (sigma-E family)
MGVNLDTMPIPEPTPEGAFAEQAQTRNAATDTADESTVDSIAGPQTFDVFFERSFDPVANALGLTLGDNELGSDAASEAMSRAYQRWTKISRYQNPAGWVYRVGLNWATSRRRKWRREIHGTQLPDKGAEDPGPDHALSAALAELSVDQRSVVILRYYLDLSEIDTASALGISPGTVKSRLSRALARLAHTMENDDGI